MKVNLDDFTRVVDKAVQDQSPHLRQAGTICTKVYLATPQGFCNFCETCEHLLMTQEVGSNVFKHRVFCGVEKCVK